MPDSIEDRVVQMTFDNKNFERKLAETVASLEKLKRTLEFKGAGNGLDQISAASRSFNLSGMTNAIEGVSKKFLALSTIAITTLATITTHAVQAGARVIKALSIDPVLQGYREYETQIGSIQTILANTASDGTNLEQVNAALDTLNKYSDQTIYNFSEMARNIGTFTAAGVDLDTSVNSIKGIANLAAISGSSSEQASTAMYQLSQAISTGVLRLQDWNSVVNAGMGGEVFQKALFDTGKRFGQIADADIDTSFEKWKEAGNSFRGSLEDNWLTAEILTTTLQAFTGDLTEAQLMSLGYTQEQAAEMLKLGQLGKAAATEVKTLTQLLGTVKESVSSGWAQSFRIIFGDFEEAKTLFTDLSNTIGGIVGRSADARNALLQGWKDLGGRTSLIEGFKAAFESLGKILAPIKAAFRDIFPKITSQRLFELTEKFKELMENMAPGQRTVANIRAIFSGFFSAIKIGIEIVKGIIGFVGDLFAAFGGGEGHILTTAAGFGDFITKLQQTLVEGGKIKAFFDSLVEVIKNPLPFLKELGDKIKEAFASLFGGGDGLDIGGFGINLPGLEGILAPFEGIIDRISQRFETVKTIVRGIADAFKFLVDRFRGIADALSGVFDYIVNWFSELGQKLAAVMKPGDFDAVVDVVNVGLLGAIALLLKRFLTKGFSFDFGSGLLSNIADSFEQLTGVLSAMQTNLRADALLKIAAAIGILTASVVILSLIDSVALTKALTAMAVGFGQLIGSFAILNALSTGTGAAKLPILAAGLILLSTAILILSVAVRILAGLDWDELAKGLVGVGALLAIVSVAGIVLSSAGPSLALAGIGMIGVAAGLVILSQAVKMFADMSWAEIGKGLAAVAGTLIVIGIAMNLMPATMPLIGAGLLMVAGAMVILAQAMEMFAAMSWSEMGKGMVALAGGLLIIAVAMNLMPATMPLIGAGLLLVSISLLAIAEALQKFGGMSWSEIARGLVAMGGSLLVLAAGAYAMSGALPGAIAIGAMAISLGLLTRVIKEFSKLSWDDMLRGIGGIAIAIGALAAAALLVSPAIGPIIALGAALIVVGAGFALFGAGAALIAKSFEIMAKVGASGAKAMVSALKTLVAAIPAILSALAQSIIEFAEIFIRAAPVFVKGIGVIIGHLLDTVVELAPKFAEALIALIENGFQVVREIFPQWIQLGLEMLLALLSGLRDNIGEITTTVAEIITNFLDALSLKVPEIIDSVFNLLIAVVKGVVEKLVDVGSYLIPIGVDLIAGLLEGIVNKIPDVTSFFTELPGNILKWIGQLGEWLLNKGVDLIAGLLKGLLRKIPEVTTWFRNLPNDILKWLGNLTSWLFAKGWDLIKGLAEGIVKKAADVITWFTELPGKIIGWIGDVSNLLWDIGWEIIDSLWDGMKSVWEDVKNWLSDIGGAIVGLKGPPKRDEVLLYNNGALIMQGLQSGMEDVWDDIEMWLTDLSPSDSMTDSFNKAFDSIVNNLTGLDGFSPTITPVLDLSNVRRDAASLSDMFGLVPIGAQSFAQAGMIAEEQRVLRYTPEEETGPTQPQEITFEQNIYSPTALRTADIYKATRSQIALAKEELSIP